MEQKRCSRIRHTGEGKTSPGDNFVGKISSWENFVTPPILVQGHQTQETVTPQPLVPCGQSIVRNFGRPKF